MGERPMYRQGDVLLDGVGRLPPGAAVRPLPAERGRLVLAYGEATGHLHSVPASAGELLEVTQEGGRTRRFLRIVAPTSLTHQEHAAIDLAPGLYRVGLQSEYVPAPGWHPRRRTVRD